MKRKQQKCGKKKNDEKRKCQPKMLIAEYLKRNLRITLSLYPAENVAAERMAIEP